MDELKTKKETSLGTILLAGGLLAGLYYAFKKGMLNFGATQTPATEEQPQVEAVAQFTGDAADLQAAVEQAGGTVSSIQGNVATITIPQDQYNAILDALNVVSVQPTGNVVQQTTQPVTGTAVTPTPAATPPVAATQIPQSTIDAYNLLCQVLNNTCYKDKNGNINAANADTFNTMFSNFLKTYGYIFPPTSSSVANAVALKNWMDVQIMEKTGGTHIIPYDQFVYKFFYKGAWQPSYYYERMPDYIENGREPVDALSWRIQEATGSPPILGDKYRALMTAAQWQAFLTYQQSPDSGGAIKSIIIEEA